MSDQTTTQSGTADQTKTAPNSGQASSTSPNDLQMKYDNAVEKLQHWMSKATHYEKTWGTLGEFDQVKSVLESNKQNGKGTQSDNSGSGKGSRETEALQAQLTELSKKLESSQVLNKQLRVVGEAMKAHGNHFVPKSEPEIESIVKKFCDFDERANCIVVRGENGDIRYSKENPGALMTVEEFFGEIKAARPYLAKAEVRGGTMSQGQASYGNNSLPNNASGIPAHLMGDKKALTAFLKNNPQALASLLNNGV